MDARAVDRTRHARLVPRRLGGDDGGDDASLGRADGCALFAHDEESITDRPVPLRLPAISSPGRASECSRSRSRAAGGRISGDVLAWDRAGRWVAGATLIVAAAYELTPLKDVCLGKCRSPLGFLLGSWRSGRVGGLRMGISHGGWCIGCCWALMASLFALGVMSLVWMAVVAGLIAFEKLIPSRRAATYGTAAVLLVLGVLLLWLPTQSRLSRSRATDRCPGWAGWAG